MSRTTQLVNGLGGVPTLITTWLFFTGEIESVIYEGNRPPRKGSGLWVRGLVVSCSSACLGPKSHETESRNMGDFKQEKLC